jgi:hypothetical protein
MEWSTTLSWNEHPLLFVKAISAQIVFSLVILSSQHTIMELSSFTIRQMSCQWIHGLAHLDVHGVSGLSCHGMIIHGFFY